MSPPCFFVGLLVWVLTVNKSLRGFSQRAHRGFGSFQGPFPTQCLLGFQLSKSPLQFRNYRGHMFHSGIFWCSRFILQSFLYQFFHIVLFLTTASTFLHHLWNTLSAVRQSVVSNKQTLHKLICLPDSSVARTITQGGKMQTLWLGLPQDTIISAHIARREWHSRVTARASPLRSAGPQILTSCSSTKIVWIYYMNSCVKPWIND